MMRRFALLALLILLLSACAPQQWGGGPVESSSAQANVSPQPVLEVRTLTPTVPPLPILATTVILSPTPAPPTPTPTPEGPTPTATPDTRPLPNDWGMWPTVPTPSAHAMDLFRQGIADGNDPKKFSVVGDCQSLPNVFLGIYATDRYWFTDDTKYLQAAVDYYQQSFNHLSVSAKDGLSAPSALSPLWSDPNQCESGENPVQCELRLNKPSVLFINLGTNWRADASEKAYENYLRQIIEITLANHTLPVLSTKADDIEGGNRINRVTAELAYEYDIPLINVWRAVQDLPDHGLDPARDNVYMTPDAWDRRNFTALRMLYEIQKANGEAPAQ